jgi:hypothetical protein
MEPTSPTASLPPRSRRRVRNRLSPAAGRLPRTRPQAKRKEKTSPRRVRGRRCRTPDVGRYFACQIVPLATQPDRILRPASRHACHDLAEQNGSPIVAPTDEHLTGVRQKNRRAGNGTAHPRWYPALLICRHRVAGDRSPASRRHSCTPYACSRPLQIGNRHPP